MERAFVQPHDGTVHLCIARHRPGKPVKEDVRWNIPIGEFKRTVEETVLYANLSKSQTPTFRFNSERCVLTIVEAKGTTSVRWLGAIGRATRCATISLLEELKLYISDDDHESITSSDDDRDTVDI